MVTELELAWAAGVFDGEGCISIGYVAPTEKNGLVNPSYRLTIKVTMCHEETVRRVHQILQEGTVQRHQRKGERINASWSWVAMSRKGYRAILKLSPYLVTKAEEARIAIQFGELPDVVRGGRDGSPRIDPALLRRKHDLYLQCAQLKPRHRFRRYPPAANPGEAKPDGRLNKP